MKKEKGLIQSNLATFGMYKFSSWQMNCLVHLVEQLQPAMSRDIDWLSADLKVFQEHLPLDKNGNLLIPIQMKEIDKYHHGSIVLNEIKKMFKQTIKYNLPTNRVNWFGGSAILSLRWILTRMTTSYWECLLQVYAGFYIMVKE